MVMTRLVVLVYCTVRVKTVSVTITVFIFLEKMFRYSVFGSALVTIPVDILEMSLPAISLRDKLKIIVK